MELELTDEIEQEFKSLEQFASDDTDYVVRTSAGSVYNLLTDGTSKRFKLMDLVNYPVQDYIVFIPDYESLKKLTTLDESDFIVKYGNNEYDYCSKLQALIRETGLKKYVCGAEGIPINDGRTIRSYDGRLFILFVDNGSVVLVIPVSQTPVLGYRTYDTRKFREAGNIKRETHIGNAVTEILEK